VTSGLRSGEVDRIDVSDQYILCGPFVQAPGRIPLLSFEWILRMNPTYGWLQSGEIPETELKCPKTQTPNEVSSKAGIFCAHHRVFIKTVTCFLETEWIYAQECLRLLCVLLLIEPERDQSYIFSNGQ
jgi:hypothetical protein